MLVIFRTRHPSLCYFFSSSNTTELAEMTNIELLNCWVTNGTKCTQTKPEAVIFTPTNKELYLSGGVNLVGNIYKSPWKVGTVVAGPKGRAQHKGFIWEICAVFVFSFCCHGLRFSSWFISNCTSRCLDVKICKWFRQLQRAGWFLLKEHALWDGQEQSY